MTTRLSVATTLVLVMLPLGVTRTGFTAAAGTQQNPAAQAAPQPPPPGMRDMMKMHEQMMAEMKAADAKLDALVKDMNAATGDAKIAAVAAVVNELVNRHKAMHGHMEQMHQHMMMDGRGRMMRR